MVYIVMGVSGSGKTHIGSKLAKELALPFYDADDFHPAANVQKMEGGAPLNDEDRRPWLQLLAAAITEWNKNGGAVLACSALKKKYRQQLQARDGQSRVIYLKGAKELISRRMADRSDHFMPQELLNSQFEALEEPTGALTVAVDAPPREIVQGILDRL